MKLFLAAVMTLLSVSGYAAFSEVECEGHNGVKSIYVEIEQPFPSTSVFRRVLVEVSTPQTRENYYHTVSLNRYGGFSIVNYQGAGFRMQLDLWPDNQPRWGRTYSATLVSSNINGGLSSSLFCRFPNAN